MKAIETIKNFFGLIKIPFTKSISGKGTYFVYFQDNIFEASTLHNFVEMLRSFFKPSKLEVTIHEKELSIKSEYLYCTFAY